MKSLLEHSFKNCQDLTYEKVKDKDFDSIDRVLYEKVVELSRIKIRKALQKQKLLLIVRTIYLLKNFSVTEVLEEILGNLNVYSKSYWRLYMVHAVCSYILSQNKEERIRDVIDTCDAFLPYSGAEKEKELILSHLIRLKSLKEDHLFHYLDIYSIFSSFLVP